MKAIKYLSVIYLFCIPSTAIGQYIVLEEQTTENYMNYLNQMVAVKGSLVKNVFNPNLQISKNFKFSDSLLHRLSKKFKMLMPAGYDGSGSVLQSETKPDSKKGWYIKYTFGAVVKDEIEAYAELIVYFDIESGGLKYPKIQKIEAKEPEIKKIKSAKIIKEYNDRNSGAQILPPLPGH